MKINIRILYLYLFSFIGLLVVIMASINMVDIGLKYFVFKDADSYEVYMEPKRIMLEGDSEKVLSEEEIEEQRIEREERVAKDQKRSRQRDLSKAISMLAVGAPLYFYHWNLIKKEKK